MGCAEKQSAVQVIPNDLRAPAYPLITIDPYTSAWSCTDKLYDESVKHWTGTNFPLIGAIRVDGEVFRFMGVEEPPLKTIAAMSTEKEWIGKYTFNESAKGWENRSFNDVSWKKDKAAFGTADELNVQTLWLTKDIWVRRDIDVTENLTNKKVFLIYSHDDIFELYVNGIQVVETGYVWRKNVILELPVEVVKTLTAGNNVIAAHCHNRTGGALVDFGLYVEDEIPTYLDRTAVQKSADVQATQTHYTFDCGNVELKVSFTAPLFMDDLYLVSRPVNYISYEVNALDNQEHDVQAYFETAPHWALNIGSQPSRSEMSTANDLLYLKTGSTEQNILGRSGDDVKIDWGYFYLSADTKTSAGAYGNPYSLRSEFANNGKVAASSGEQDNVNTAISQDLGNGKNLSGFVMLEYDDLYSIQYFGENLRPYWNKNGDKKIEDVFAEAWKDFDNLKKRCDKFDLEHMQEALQAGGKEYAEICALAYRQAISAHKVVEAPNGDLLFLSKENNSNGSIGTVDITYPSAPMFLYYNPELVKGLMNHIFYYSESGKWTKPFPSHDIGTIL